MKIGIIEDEKFTNEVLGKICTRELELEVVVSETHGGAGLAAILCALPDLAILDLSLPDMDGLDIAKAIFLAIPACRILAVSALRDPLTILRVKGLGLHGFFDKRDMSVAMLKSAITTIATGRRYYSPVYFAVLQALRKNPRPFHLLLTAQEQRLMIYVANAHSDSEIAEMTGLKEATVQSRRRDIMQKLNVHSTPKLIKYAGELGFGRLGTYLSHPTPRSAT